jgi:hypothetical protein
MKCSPKDTCVKGLVLSWWSQSLRGNWIIRAITSSKDLKFEQKKVGESGAYLEEVGH